GRVDHADAAEAERAAGMRAAADRDAIGVARHELHRVDRHAEPFGDQLRKARLVALPLGCRADDDLDGAADAALRLHRHFGLLARRAGGGVDIVRDPNAAIFAVPTRRLAPLRNARPIRDLQHAPHDAVIGAAVTDHA